MVSHLWARVRYFAARPEYTFRPLTARAQIIQRAVTDLTTGGPPFINGPNGKELHAVGSSEANAVLSTLMDSYIERYGHDLDLPAGRLVDRTTAAAHMPADSQDAVRSCDRD